MLPEYHEDAVMTDDITTTNNELASWLKSPWYSVDEAMNLIMGFAPSTYRFDYGKEQDMPEGSVPIYRALIQAIREFKLPVYIRNIAITSEEAILLLNESFQENVVSYDEYLHSCWWHDGKLFRHQLIDWLEENKIPSKSFGVLQSAIAINAPSASTGSRKDTARITATRKACEEVAEELHQEKNAFESNKDNWKPRLLDDTGRTTKKIFMETAQNHLSEILHRDTAVEAWRNVPTELKHRGRVREQLSSTESPT